MSAMSWPAALPFSPETAITVMAALAAFGIVWAVWSALVVPDLMSTRAKRLRRRQDELRAGMLSTRRQAQHKAAAMGLMRRVTLRLNLLKAKTGSKTVERLAQAGWRSKDALVIFVFMKLVLPFVFAAGAFFLFNVMQLVELDETMAMLAPIAGLALGAYAPETFVKNAITKRQKLLQQGLPDAIDLLVICAEAGLSLDAALNRVSHEIQRASPEIAEEIGLTAIELGFLPERRQALDNFLKRCPLPAVRGIVNTLLQTEKYGTPLANALRVLAAEYREERMLKAEAKAARLPALLTVPMIVFIMPSLFVVIIGPAAIGIIDNFINQ
ncbi:MAG TPA: type II secretion system F family protein [Rhodospirillales bacterium]|nr:type II secretion system F family protein [Rhodospirillales bacterium]